MIVLDTHVWVWWVHGTAPLTPANAEFIDGAAAAVLTLVVIPAVFLVWKQHALKEPTGVGVVTAGEA